VTEKFRITYATMSADNEELQAAYDAAAERAKAELGKTYPVVVNGEERCATRPTTSPHRSTKAS
jgi:1-pyrroline-5-carboxylate dehydrogenase